MTDAGDRVNLDEYSQILADLETEVREYGKQRASLQEVVTALRQIEAANDRTQDLASASIAEGARVFASLAELDLANQIAGLESRYNQHQQSLTDVAAKMQQIVQEQQRASLETLQNAQHTRESLERGAKDARAAAEAHENKIAGVGEQLGTLSTQVSDSSADLATMLRAQGENLADIQRQLAVTRMVAIITLMVLVGFAMAVVFKIV